MWQEFTTSLIGGSVGNHFSIPGNGPGSRLQVACSRFIQKSGKQMLFVLSCHKFCTIKNNICWSSYIRYHFDSSLTGKHTEAWAWVSTGIWRGEAILWGHLLHGLLCTQPLWQAQHVHWRCHSGKQCDSSDDIRIVMFVMTLQWPLPHYCVSYPP